MQLETLTVGPLGTNCYLVWHEGGDACAVIDPGSHRTEVLDALHARGLTADAVFLTHGHFDHVGGVALLAEAFPAARTFIHPGDTGDDKRYCFTPPDGWIALNDGDVISAGGLQFEVLHTPGHSPGSVTLRCGDCLFTGDTLFKDSMGRTDLRGGSETELAASLARLGRLDGDFRVLPGHMAASTLTAERQFNRYLRRAMDA